jgi:hypothetical protein
MQTSDPLLISVIYDTPLKFRGFSESLPQDPLLQKAINETKMNFCEGEEVRSLFKGRVLFVFFNGLVLAFEDDGLTCNLCQPPSKYLLSTC